MFSGLPACSFPPHEVVEQAMLEDPPGLFFVGLFPPRTIPSFKPSLSMFTKPRPASGTFPGYLALGTKCNSPEFAHLRVFFLRCFMSLSAEVWCNKVCSFFFFPLRLPLFHCHRDLRLPFLSNSPPSATTSSARYLEKVTDYKFLPALPPPFPILSLTFQSSFPCFCIF